MLKPAKIDLKNDLYTCACCLVLLYLLVVHKYIGYPDCLGVRLYGFYTAIIGRVPLEKRIVPFLRETNKRCEFLTLSWEMEQNQISFFTASKRKKKEKHCKVFCSKALIE